MAYNRVILHGRITKDIELKKTQGDVSFCKFSVAVDRAYKSGDAKQTDFIECSAWRGTADFLGKYFGKGSEIVLEGKLQNNNYTDNDGVKHYGYIVLVDNVDFCGKKSDNAAPTGQAGEPTETPNFTEIPEDGDLPF